MNPSGPSRVLETAVAQTSDRRRIAELEAQLAEAQETLDAIRNGDVDAVVMGGPNSRKVYTLETADRSYRLLIEQMREGATMLSADSVVLYGNRCLAGLLHLPPETVVGQRFARFVCPGDQAAFAVLLAIGGTAELQLVRPDGDTFPARLSLGELSTDGGPVMCGVVTDLTDAHALARDIGDARSRLAVEAARRELSEGYRLILESATDFAIISTDLQGWVTIWSAGARDILGWEARDVVGRPAPMIWTCEDQAAGIPADEMTAALLRGRLDVARWHVRRDGSAFWASSLVQPLRDAAGAPIGFLRILRDRTQEKRAEENQRTLINELNHRVKNTLSTVQSIATQTLRTASTPYDARQALEERLMALSRAHDVLTRGSWESARLSEIVDEALAAYRDAHESRIHVAGPDVRVPPRMALALSMALHELATNAVKYGALACDTGEISVDWTIATGSEAAAAPRLHLRWEERGGPIVVAPSRRGFGSRLIERSLAAELGGEVEMRFAPAGVVCVIEAAIEDPPD